MCKKNRLDQATRWSSVRVFVRPCSVNRLQSTYHENSYRGQTRGLIELNFFTHIPWYKWAMFWLFLIFSWALFVRSKNTLTLPPPSYVSILSDHTVLKKFCYLREFCY